MPKMSTPGPDKSDGNGEDPGHIDGEDHTVEDIEGGKEPGGQGAYGGGSMN